ncbi:amino acid ABC transporter ATP-binding protein [Tanticharoenia sakaeratensis]|uniref:ABC transporter ATP-binding protein n=1 Tax=Tanticharoenia sakaeratensis NBRC 103193 TaxID=1231623 RepID=A0A0D6ML47_9PROT|nr:amino acid ABC transporter ATP-binding protein [Tanticharoenia sakaeratensis]GAN54384.1 ABC transporter ATP-binding protein [Tanticharoenia sakaeratensis NBRC 103193]GBQ18767.1 amino acid transporter ATP-binding protein [Tanticharoenia sakaeratensis NBRC 103193]
MSDATIPGEPMIAVSALRKSFGQNVVLHDVSLDVPQGGVTALIGPSGSGKSTLLRCINLLERPDGGSLRVDRTVLDFDRVGRKSALPARALAEIRAEAGMVFQSFNLFPHMSVIENVASGPIYVRRIPRATAMERARALLDRVGLAHRADASPAMLSGGQKQRVAIARALAMDPRIMLFDEATSALDPALVGEVLSIMRTLADDGMTMIVVTHEMAFARDVADEVVFMADGYVVERGAARQVIEAPNEARTKEFLRHFHLGASA